jgi:hypothetical protein
MLLRIEDLDRTLQTAIRGRHGQRPGWLGLRFRRRRVEASGDDYAAALGAPRPAGLVYPVLQPLGGRARLSAARPDARRFAGLAVAR